MKFVKNIARSFILRSDMFAAQPTLRFNGESSYETICGGCVSFIMVVGFIAIFSSSFVDVINKVNISATLNVEDNPYESSEITGIALAVGIAGLDFSSTERYFGIILKLRNSPIGGGAPTSTQIELGSCSSSDWEDYGEHFSKLYEVYGMSQMLCPTNYSSLMLKGFEGSQQWITMSILVEQCRNLTGASWTCHSPEEIQASFETMLTTQDFVKVNLLILNTVISPQQEDATNYVLENEIFVTFSNTSGSRCDLKLGRYELTTDNSIWPMSDETTEQGYYITSHDTYSINLYSTHYVRIEMEKARTIYQISRTHDKLDEMLSYVGGLFALIFGWLFFFFGSYNQYKYEIAVAEHTFSMDGTGRKMRQDNFGFFTYLKYCLFDWMKTFNICISWPAMQQIDSARQEANQQMDVRYLMKKIQRYEIINKFLMGEHNLILANLSKPPTLEQVKRMRKITQYYDKVIKVQNQESLLKSILKVSQEGNKEQVFDGGLEDEKTIDKIEENQDMDSQDEEIEKEIAEIYKQNKLKDLSQTELTLKILEQMPRSMKDRLKRIKNAQTDINFVGRQKIKIESSFSLGQNAPNFFQGLTEYKQQK